MHSTINCGATNEQTGQVVDVAESVTGPTADIKLWRSLTYSIVYRMGLEPSGTRLINHAFSQRRIIVEHTIGRLRRYQAITQTDRHHRKHYTQRVVAIAGLVNRQIQHRFPSLVA